MRTNLAGFSQLDAFVEDVDHDNAVPEAALTTVGWLAACHLPG